MSSLRRALSLMVGCVAFFGGAPACFGDDTTAIVHSSTEVPSDSRYQLVQSPLLARFMLRVDRFSGEVDQLAIDTKENEYFWIPVKMEKSALKKFHVYTDNRVHFQVFLSGILAKNTFLMDVDTGTTWVIVKDQKEEQWWENVN